MDVPVSAVDAPSVKVQESNKTSGIETRIRVPSPHHSLPKYEHYTVATLLSNDFNVRVQENIGQSRDKFRQQWRVFSKGLLSIIPPDSRLGLDG